MQLTVNRWERQREEERKERAYERKKRGTKREGEMDKGKDAR